MSKKIMIKRLRHLRAILRKPNIKGIKFNLRHWFGIGGRSATACEKECFTAACAIGLACLDEKFQKEGLGIDDFSNILVPSFNKYIGDCAVMDFFGLSIDEVRYLFYKTSYLRPTKNAVYKRIGKYLKRMNKGRSDYTDVYTGGCVSTTPVYKGPRGQSND